MAILRRGMWVKDSQEQIGILNEAQLGVPFGVVHYTDENGVTVKIGNAPLVDLRQAAYKDIPVPRRCDEETAKKLGYL